MRNKEIVKWMRKKEEIAVKRDEREREKRLLEQQFNIKDNNKRTE